MIGKVVSSKDIENEVEVNDPIIDENVPMKDKDLSSSQSNVDVVGMNDFIVNETVSKRNEDISSSPISDDAVDMSDAIEDGSVKIDGDIEEEEEKKSPDDANYFEIDDTISSQNGDNSKEMNLDVTTIVNVKKNKVTLLDATSAILTLGVIGLGIEFFSAVDTLLATPVIFFGAKSLTNDYLQKMDKDKNKDDDTT